MNYRTVVYFLGRIIRIEGLAMLLAVVCSLIYRETVPMVCFLCTAAALILMGSAFVHIMPPKDKSIGSKDGIVIVALSWIIMSVLGAIPFYVSGEIPSYIDAFFETVSGFTTTGSSILTNVEALSHGMNFWRCFTHWIGGMGVLMLMIAIIPKSDVRSSRLMHIMRAEVPGYKVDKVVSKIKNTAIVMYGIYLALTVFEFIALLFADMPVYDSLLTALATAGTGGFGVKADSLASYSPAIQYVVGAFMLIFAINFNVYYFIIIKQIKKALRSEELRWFLSGVAVFVAIISFNLVSVYQTAEECFRQSFFQVASIMSTTGFASADFNLWPDLSKTILFFLIFSGGCVGSTCGGLKIARLMILFKSGLREIKQVFRPRAVISVKLEGKTIENETIRSTSAYFIIYCAIILIGALLIAVFEQTDIITSLTSSMTAVNNVGPGLGEIVGPAGNFSSFSIASKLILCFEMLAGRLELFPMLLIFAPSIWKASRHHSN